MRIGPKILAWGGLAAFLGIIVVFAMPSYRHGEASIAGKRAEDFTMELSGKPSHLSDFRGKVVVLGVAADEDPAIYEAFLREHAVIFPTYRDPATKDNHSPIAQSYGTVMIPETYIIDRQGKIARKIIGFQEWDSPEMLAYFDSILGKT